MERNIFDTLDETIKDNTGGEYYGTQDVISDDTPLKYVY